MEKSEGTFHVYRSQRLIISQSHDNSRVDSIGSGRAPGYSSYKTDTKVSLDNFNRIEERDQIGSFKDTVAGKPDQTHGSLNKEDIDDD